MVDYKDIKVGELMLYVFIPTNALNLQSVKLEQVYVYEVAVDGPKFKIAHLEGNSFYQGVSVEITEDDAHKLFYHSDKEEAEVVWVKEFIKHFKATNGISMAQFINLYRKVQDEYPEWILQHS
jgi:hypothetical protein